MKIFIDNHKFRYEVENVAQLFFPYEKFEIIEGTPDSADKSYICTSVADELKASAVLEDFSEEMTAPKASDSKTDETMLCRLLYDLLNKYTGIDIPWGMITGVRPVKYLRSLISRYGREYAEDHFLSVYRVQREKLELALTTEKYEREILNSSKEKSFSLYVSIPFCPTRCSYCSFVSQAVSKTKHLVEPYLDLLCKELELTAELVDDFGLELESVYIGGGTPTTLSAPQLDKLTETINRCFDMPRCREFTVEAGRPDTVTAEKLRVLKNAGVNRISINPQTFSDTVLESIGRKHTTANTMKAFELAQAERFFTVNSDLIAGLPKDTVESFKHSLNSLIQLGTENITVHTLAIKRSADYTEQGLVTDAEDAERVGEMLRFAQNRLTESGYVPYYLYRQSRMVGNFENVGWAKPGHEGIYNVFIMDETHTILACGAGAVTKLKNPHSGELKRVFNYKFPYEYIDRFSEIKKRKEQIVNFFSELQ